MARRVSAQATLLGFLLLACASVPVEETAVWVRATVNWLPGLGAHEDMIAGEHDEGARPGVRSRP